MDFISDDGGDEYNLSMCKSFSHCLTFLIGMRHTVYNNFEIGDMDFWRGEAYTAFFEYLDRTGGFYYEVL